MVDVLSHGVILLLRESDSVFGVRYGLSSNFSLKVGNQAGGIFTGETLESGCFEGPQEALDVFFEVL
jgi:hypothetical protein